MVNFYNDYMIYDDLGQYVVQSGDSLFSIAQKYGTTVENLMGINNLSSTMIYPNQVLFVPYISDSMLEEYMTVTGDNLNGIAKRFGISPNSLASYNDIYSLRLAPNQVIRINENRGEYVVKEGDTVEDILSRFSLNASRLAELNNWIRVGQSIVIK